MNHGLVSCIIPTYKRSDLLLRAIHSVLNQTYTNIELIVVDDNYPNDEFSMEVQRKINSIEDNRLRYIQQETHRNGAVARNIGIAAANGEYIAFLDDDDEWLLEKIEIQKKILDTLPAEYGAVSCLAMYYYNDVLQKHSTIYNDDNLHKQVLERSVSIHTDTVLFRQEALSGSGGFDETLLRHQEIQLFLDFLINYKIKLISQYLIKIHRDDAQNRPNTEKIIQVKQAFFDSTKKHFDLYDRHIRKRLYSAHYFEIVFVAIKEKKIGEAFNHLTKVGINIPAYLDLYHRYLMRRRGS
ncbi:glycosyltransferase family 2 protein [Sporomusa malonica]|uniref:Glycosyl transferase family 2 n=1 Tax=Sporomusa malonica TaxID=112901 RepID=A0A1W1YUB3_9FIRM|nr:glycosyltransferase family 2 protein [Sporomusa malonica]SMC39308.1 Glycosyl transferase family 2 [Sporomusa malonica]